MASIYHIGRIYFSASEMKKIRTCVRRPNCWIRTIWRKNFTRGKVLQRR